MEKLYDIFKKGTSLKMTLEEKAAMRTRILAYMNKATTPSPYHGVISPYTPRFSFRFMHVAKVMALVLIVVLVGGETLAYASQDALPGDGFLYAVKVNVAEEITATFKVSHEEKIAWISERMDRRINEVKVLKEENNLTPENEKIVTSAFMDHTKALDEDLAKLEASGKSEVVVAIADDLIPKLDTYEKVINGDDVTLALAPSVTLPDEDTDTKALSVDSTVSENIESTLENTSLSTIDDTENIGGVDTDGIQDEDMVPLAKTLEADEDTVGSEVSAPSELGDLIRMQRSVLIAKKEVALESIDEEQQILDDAKADTESETSELMGMIEGHVTMAGATFACLSPENALPGISLTCTSIDPNLFLGRTLTVYQNDEIITTIDLSKTGPNFSLPLPVGTYEIVYSGVPTDGIQKEKQTITVEADSSATYTNLIKQSKATSATNVATVSGTVTVEFSCPVSDVCVEPVKKPGISILISDPATAKVIKTVSVKTDGTFTTTMPEGTYTLSLVEIVPSSKASAAHRFTSIPATLSLHAYETQTISFAVSIVQ